MKSFEEFMKEEGSAFPGKTYVEELLKPVFNDQRDFLFDAMFALHEAHLVMLHEQGLLNDEDTRKILGGLEKLKSTDKGTLTYTPEYEDLFFMMEGKLGELIGADLAGKMHIARSRNDMGEGMYRLVIRGKLLSLIEDVHHLSEALLEQAANHVEDVMPAHTHTQPAQPTTFGHYLMAIFDQLQRDRKRLWHAFDTVNQSPLGAAAITTTGFPISRERLAELLGYDGVLENSYDAIATGDYLLESAQAVVSLMVNTGRWIQEFLRFSTKEVGLIVVADPHVQISSIMPQKRNPVSIEHSRAIASSSLGEAMTVVHMLHNTPYGDIVDTEDDLQPNLYNSLRKASRVMRLMYAIVRTMTFNSKKAADEARKHLITITELADVLTRDHGVSFRKAHGLAAKIAKRSTAVGIELDEWEIAEVNEMLGEVELTKEEWEAIADPKVFVERRSIRGGPASVEVRRMIGNRELELSTEEEKFKETVNLLEGAQSQLAYRVGELSQVEH